jgi:hypothetical protein
MAAVTVEECLDLDIHVFHRQGWLDEDGQTEVLQWTRDNDGAQVATAGYLYLQEDDVEAVVIIYTVSPQRPGDEDREIVLPITIERTACHFGGDRPWFLCPECESRQGKLYKPPEGDERFLCRDCHGLIYRSQSHRSPLVEAFDQLDSAAEDVQEDGVSRETLREFYEAKQDVIETFNDHLDDVDEEFQERDWREQMQEPPPFDEWVEDLFASDLGRDYGEHGQCEASARTTGERCRQPATGEHGKCYYHGGAECSGVSTTES